MRTVVKMASAVIVGSVAMIAEELLYSSDNEDDTANRVCLAFSVSRDERIKTTNFYEETAPLYLPDTFKRFFRVNRTTVELLCRFLAGCNELTARISPGGRTPIPLEKKILLTLRYLASQENLLDISDRFNITEFSALNCRRQVINALNRTCMSKFIKWPDSADYPTIAQDFTDIGNRNFPNILGAIDGTFIRIEAPHMDPQSYFNRKKFHSIILQAVCIADLRFTNINVGWPGRVHDAKVLRNSALWDTGYQKTQHGRYHLLGDAAYPLKQWLLTPYRENAHRTPQEKRFNQCLSSKRQVIERAFASLKGRFRRLKHAHVKSMKELSKIVVTACILHNVCILQGDDLEDMIDNDEDDDDPQRPDIMLQQNDAEGQLKRIAITNAM